MSYFHNSYFQYSISTIGFLSIYSDYKKETQLFLMEWCFWNEEYKGYLFYMYVFVIDVWPHPYR